MITKASDSLYAKVEAISTGLPQLDRVTGIGGIPKRRITEISGTWSVGKTTLALALIKSAQEQGIDCVWMDAEWSWDEEYAKALGVDTTQLGLLQTRYSESAMDEILEHLDKTKNSLIVIDAVGALHPKDEAEKESGERTVGAQSSLVARFCRKAVPLLAMNNHALVVLNHEYTPIMATGGRPQLKTSGGAKLEYHKSMWIRLSKTGVHLKQGDVFVGFKVEAEIRKNKLASTQKQSCELEMFYGQGFNAESDLLQDALDKQVVQKVGNSYFIGDTKIAVGMPKLREYVKENAETIKTLLNG